MTKLGELYKASRTYRKKKAFSRLRHNAAAGETWAAGRLRWHVRRRLARGWRLSTIAKRMGMEVADVQRYVGFDMTPRLVRVERGQ
jgi:hypothetical protein